MSGRPPDVTDDELIQAVKEQCDLHGIPVVKTAQVHESDRITIQLRQMRERLTDLHKDGEVGMLEVGESSVFS